MPEVVRDLQKQNPASDRVVSLMEAMAWRVAPRVRAAKQEVAAFVYSAACERMLVPIAAELARGPAGRYGVTVVAARELTAASRERLERAGCRVERSAVSLMRAWNDPSGKVVLLCLDHRMHREHRLGVVVAEALERRGIRTLCIQHGGCRDDSIASLASSASDRLLVWGEATRRGLVENHCVPADRIEVVGNPLHDGIFALDAQRALAELRTRRPASGIGSDGRKIIVLATTLQREYAMYPDEQARYARYMKHVYASIDFSRAVLVIKAHPCDPTGASSLYESLRGSAASPDSILLIGAEDRALDVYALVAIADLVLTRCSTVAEEALLMGKKVVAFDLEADGLSQYYRHLERFGDYRTVYESPPDALGQVLRTALFSERLRASVGQDEIVHELTLALDGRSAARAAAAVWQEVQRTSHQPSVPGQRS